MSSIALVAIFIKFYYARLFVEIVQYSIIQLRIVAISSARHNNYNMFCSFSKIQGYIFLPIRGQMGREKKSAFEKGGEKIKDEKGRKKKKREGKEKKREKRKKKEGKVKEK